MTIEQLAAYAAAILPGRTVIVDGSIHVRADRTTATRPATAKLVVFRPYEDGGDIDYVIEATRGTVSEACRRAMRDLEERIASGGAEYPDAGCGQ